MVKFAAIQMCSGDVVEDNLKIASDLIKRAAQNGAQLVVLPEMFAIMGKKHSDKISIKENYGAGPIQDFLSRTAADLNIWIVGGTIPIACENNSNKIRAACLVYNNEGKAVARYDKIHLFDVELSENEIYRESDITQAGDQIVTVQTPFGKIGLSVCYDVRFPALYTQMLNQGAEIFTIPAAFTVPTGQAHWNVLMRARAIENFCYVIAAAQEGTHSSGRKTYGHAMTIDPWGTVIEELTQHGEGIVYATIDLEKLKSYRKAIPSKQHQKIALKVNNLGSGNYQ